MISDIYIDPGSHRTSVQPYHPSGRYTVDSAESPLLLLQDNTPNFGEETVEGLTLLYA